LDNSKTEDDQIKLINEMLGVDDYLYSELNTNNNGLKMDKVSNFLEFDRDLW
jgi:hypothetical protein